MFAKIVIIAFIILELSNVLALYFTPGSKRANAVGVFSAWEKSKQYPEIHDLVKYLVNWVAGTKLIFLLLLGVIVIFGDLELQQLSLIALGIATLTFFWRLFPLIRKMDHQDQIRPKNYSIILGVMILTMITLFGLAAFL
jgi:fatty acid desaturase